MNNTHYQNAFSNRNAPLFKWLFFGYERMDIKSKPQKIIILTHSYKEAKQIISQNYISSWAGKIPI
ncbi:TPA: host cell division inhibitor Icd-like protein [Providencia alcalifaciens]